MTLHRTLAMGSAFAMAFGLAGCGGSDGGGSAAPVAVAPAPSPAPAPAPTPTPTTGVMPVAPARFIAGISPGQGLLASLSCANGSFTFAEMPLNGPRVLQINSIASVNVRNGSAGNGLSIIYDAVDSYTLGLGFDDVIAVLPSHKQAPLTVAYDYFRAPGYEFELDRNATSLNFSSITLGRFYSEGTGLCFYAAGSNLGPGITLGLNRYAGIADGFALLSGKTSRLFGSPVSVTVDYPQRSGTVRIDLVGREPPFGEFFGATANAIGQATAQFALTPGSNYISDATLTGPGGSTGTITGQVFAGGSAVGLVFDLRFPNGDRAFGTIATEIPPSDDW